MPTINQWISCLEELWGDDIEIIKYSNDEIVVRLGQPRVDLPQNPPLSKRAN